jgi:hypothetical protein
MKKYIFLKIQPIIRQDDHQIYHHQEFAICYGVFRKRYLVSAFDAYTSLDDLIDISKKEMNQFGIGFSSQEEAEKVLKDFIQSDYLFHDWAAAPVQYIQQKLYPFKKIKK